MRIFLDTSGLIALSDEKDKNHNRAKAHLVEQVQKGARFVVGKNILAEYIDGRESARKKALKNLIRSTTANCL